MRLAGKDMEALTPPKSSRNCWTRELTVFETVFFTENGAETELTEVMFSSWQSQGLSSW